MDDVPDLRMFGVRILLGVGALLLGTVSAVAVFIVLPQGEGRDCTAFATLSLIVGMGAGLTLGWFALFEMFRRLASRSPSYPRAMPLPVARALRPRK